MVALCRPGYWGRGVVPGLLVHGGRECTPWACVAYDEKKMLSISHWPAAELRPLGGPPCAVARRPVVWGVVSTRAPPCAGLVRVAPPRAKVSAASGMCDGEAM